MKKALCIIVLSLNLLVGRSQDDRFSFVYQHILFESFIDSLEACSHYTVYYSQDWLDSIYTNVDIEDGMIGDVMDQVIAGHQFSYVVSGHQIILIRNQHVKTNFAREVRQYLEESRTQTDTVRYILAGTGEPESCTAALNAREISDAGMNPGSSTGLIFKSISGISHVDGIIIPAGIRSIERVNTILETYH